MARAKKQYKVTDSPIHGRGVFAAQPLARGVKLINYEGRLLTHPGSDRLYGDSLDSGHTFLFTLNDKYVIDANVDGNDARWINHSCAPNCEALLEEDADGNKRRDVVEIWTKRAIKAGEELTYDYAITLEVPHTARLKKIWACRCGARKCTGTLLRPKRKPAQARKQKGKKK